MKVCFYKNLFVAVSIFCWPVLVSAAATSSSEVLVPRDRLSVEPMVIDQQTIARDILDYKVKIVNKGDKQEEFYAIVSDITTGLEDKTASVQERENNSLSKWISIQRSQVTLQPKQSIELPLKIEVNMYAKPGARHAAIDFVSAGNTYEAEKLAKLYDNPRLLVNIDVVEDIIERAKIDRFSAQKSMFLEGKASFDLTVSNSGNRDISPQGQLLIYNRRNQEIARFPFGANEEAIEAGAKKSYDVGWQEAEILGKFKAKIELEYGSSTKRDLQDVADFWMLPKKKLVSFAVLIVLFMIMAKINGSRKRRKKRAVIVESNKPKKTDPILNLKDN